MKYFLFTLSILLILKGFSQHKIHGLVLDSETKEPVPYCHIIINHELGTITNVKGEFNFTINLINKNDILVISNISYCTDTLFLSSLIENQKTILLTPKFISLPEVMVLNSNNKEKKQRKKRYGIYHKKHLYSINSSKGNELALFIPNKKSINGIISKLYYYITDKGNPKNPFRIHLYTKDSILQSPKDEILTKNIFANAKKGNSWVTIDLTSLNISFPKDGFFISMELLPNGKDNELIVSNGYYHEKDNVQLGLSFEKKYDEYSWYKNFVTKKWVCDKDTRKGKEITVTGNYMMSCEIILSK